MTSESIAWLSLAFGCVIGLVGIFTPGVPGIGIIFLGALVHKFLLPDILSWWTVAIVGVAGVLSMVFDYLGSIAGAKIGGATKWGIFGAVIGMVVGLFFFPIGLVLGPVLGTLAAEMLCAQRTLVEAARSGVGAALGLAVSAVVRVPMAMAALGVLLVDSFLL